MDAPDASPACARSLAELEARVRYDLDCLCYPQAGWVPPAAPLDGQRVHDVAIVGGGQGGLAAAFALLRERVTDVVVLDRNPEGVEGPWETFARMPTLRTPKYLTGPDCGIPGLTYRAWHDARHAAGEIEAWDAMERIPRGRWMAYLRWLRRMTGVPVTNGVEVSDIAPAGPTALALTTRAADGSAGRLLARQVIVANGIEGGGRWTIPAALRGDLPEDRFAHTADPIDPGRLHGARVAVLGIGASALDNAGLALDAGARSVTLCFRRPAVPALEVRAWLENVGFLRGFGDLDDASRWSVMHRLLGGGAPPPAHSLKRCTDDPRFVLRPGTPWISTRWTGDEVEVTTPAGPIACDFAIFGTGAVTRLDLRPELATAAAHAALWRDRFDGADPGHPMADYPYLGPGFELLERTPGAAPWLSRLRLFNWAATASLGISASSITGMRFGLDRLIPATVRALYRETAADHIARMPWPGVSAGTAPE